MASEFFHKYLRAAALSLPVFALVSAPIASFAQAQEGIAPVTPSSAPQTPSHGIAMYGEPALKDGDSLPYARKDAPKGGEIRLVKSDAGGTVFRIHLPLGQDVHLRSAVG